MRLAPLDIFDHSSSDDAGCGLWIYHSVSNDGELLGVVNKHPLVNLITARNEEAVVVGKTNTIDPMVLLFEFEYQPLLRDTPQTNICILSSLPSGTQVASMGNSQASDEIIMTLEERLLMGIVQIPNNDHTSNSFEVVLAVRVHVTDRAVLHIATNCMLQINRHRARWPREPLNQ